MRPLFIVLEGLDGSGTSTQARLLVEYLENELDQRVRPTSEPSSGPIGQLIRTAMSGRMRFSSDIHVFDRQTAFLFAADRHDHLYNDTNGILQLISQGYFVVSTRYLFSSYAYHCTTDSDFELVRSLNSIFPNPDLTVYLDISVETSLSRLERRASLDRYKNAEKLSVVRTNYEKMFSSYGGRLLSLSGEKMREQIHSEIVSELMRIYSYD